MSQSLRTKGKKSARSAGAASSTASRPGPSQQVQDASGSTSKIPKKDNEDSEDEQVQNSEALARLQALGNDFMASFGATPVSSQAPSSSTSSKKPLKKRRKTSDEEIKETAEDEIDVLMGSLAKGKSKMKAKAPSKPKQFEPETVVFDGSAGSTSSFAQGSVDRKSFMVSIRAVVSR